MREVIAYMSFDGKLFLDAAACEKYEVEKRQYPLVKRIVNRKGFTEVREYNSKNSFKILDTYFLFNGWELRGDINNVDIDALNGGIFRNWGDNHGGFITCLIFNLQTIPTQKELDNFIDYYNKHLIENGYWEGNKHPIYGIQQRNTIYRYAISIEEAFNNPLKKYDLSGVVEGNTVTFTYHIGYIRKYVFTKI